MIVELYSTTDNRMIGVTSQSSKLKVEAQKLLDETQQLFDSLMQEYFE